jgi:hypothetical protein
MRVLHLLNDSSSPTGSFYSTTWPVCIVLHGGAHVERERERLSIKFAKWENKRLSGKGIQTEIKNKIQNRRNKEVRFF